jgi:hypothetical protein
MEIGFMTKRACLVTAGLLFGLVASGCRERNPAYLQKAAPSDASASKDVVPDIWRDDSADAQADVSGADGPDRDDVFVPRDEQVDERAVGVDVGPPGDDGDAHGTAVRDTRDGRRPGDDTVDAAADTGTGIDTAHDLAAPLDGGPSSDASDAPAQLVDGGADGLLLDATEVAGEAPAACQEQQARSCSTPGNPLVGACHAGQQVCTGGAWGVCAGEVVPAGAELCNGLDDNCNGMTDEGCLSDCVVVAPGGDDATADGTTAQPFVTVRAGMAFAVQGDGGAPRRVCVAGGGSCTESHTYAMDSSLAMLNGARVQGNYAASDAALIYCADTQPPTTALQFTAAGAHVVFGDGVSLHTELGGFAIKRFSQTGVAGASSAVSAVLVGGGKNVVLSGIFVTDAPVGDTTYGVDVENGGQVTIIGSAIGGGAGKTAAVGVFVNGGSVTLRNNCDQFSKGGCATTCTAAGLGIRGRSATSAVADTLADSSAVYLTSASTTASTIAGNALCGGPGNASVDVLGANVATLRCEGNGCGTVTGNDITAGGGQLTVAVGVANGRATLDGNAIRGTCGTEGAAGVVLDSSSARLHNNRISGGACTAGNPTGSYFGLRVMLSQAGGEPDVHSNDIEPAGASGDCESVGVAIERSQGDGVATGIFRNNIVSAGGCRNRFAVIEDSNASARIVENNDFYPGATDPGNGATVVLYRRGGTDATTAAQINALAGAAKNLSAAPKFASYPENLRLGADSPCVDTGSAEGAPATDADGNSRPAGAGYDIGAYERPSP